MSSKTFAASPSSAAPYSPLDEERSSNTQEEEGEEDVHLKTIPSGDEGLQLAIGDSAILECQLSIPSASHRFKSLSWTNTLTDVTMTTDNVTEDRYGRALCIVKAIGFNALKTPQFSSNIHLLCAEERNSFMELYFILCKNFLTLS